MNKKNHIQFGQMILTYLQDTNGIVLNKKAFLYGNIAPDLSVRVISRPHRRACASETLKEILTEVVEDGTQQPWNDFMLSQRLGQACHYCADFFCEAHCSRYDGSLKDHMYHERALAHFCNEQKKMLYEHLMEREMALSFDADGIFAAVERENDGYLSGQPTLQAQAEGALFASLRMVCSVFAASEELAHQQELAKQRRAYVQVV